MSDTLMAQPAEARRHLRIASGDHLAFARGQNLARMKAEARERPVRSASAPPKACRPHRIGHVLHHRECVPPRNSKDEVERCRQANLVYYHDGGRAWRDSFPNPSGF